MWTSDKKLNWLLTYLRPMVDSLYLPFPAPNMNDVPLDVWVANTLYKLRVPAAHRGKDIEMTVCGHVIRFSVPKEHDPVEVSTDKLRKTSLGFMRAMLDFMMLDDIIHTGDIDRLTVSLKRLLPLFVGLHSFRSKYSIEIVNFLTKTEFVASPRESVAIKLRAFVNTSGKPGMNKPADMQQENNIKQVKTVLRGLGAGKTDAALVRASKAAPAVLDAAGQLASALKLKPLSPPHAHKSKDDSDDKERLLKILRSTKPFIDQPMRILGGKLVGSASPVHTVCKTELNKHITRNCRRAVNKVDFDLE